MQFKKNIPNFITLLNLTSGVLGIVFLMRGDIREAVYMVFLAGLFDFLDGLAARALRAYSEIGKSLDSLADIVSFGVLPGLLVFKTLEINNFTIDLLNNGLPWLAFFIPAFSAVRLAIFNNDPEQSTSFKGLPTPANAFLVVSAAYVYLSLPEAKQVHTALLAAVVISGCNLMVSGLRMFSFKIKKDKKNDLLRNVSFLIVAAFLIIFSGMAGVFLSIVLYIILSAFFHFIYRNS